MRRADGLVTISRREFCGGLTACLGIAAVASCSSSDMAHPDAAAHSDASGGMCSSSGMSDVGTPSTFMTNQPVYFSAGNFFVVRDSGGLYALSARCTHEGATTIVQSGDFYCPRHGAKFDFDGNVVSGPVFTGLVHYEMCTLGNGHVGVNTSQIVPKTQRLNA